MTNLFTRTKTKTVTKTIYYFPFTKFYLYESIYITAYLCAYVCITCSMIDLFSCNLENESIKPCSQYSNPCKMFRTVHINSTSLYPYSPHLTFS